MSSIKIIRNGQITIPIELRRQLGIEKGDLVEFKIIEDQLILVPKKLIDKSQTYFWTSKWQTAEREAQTDIQEGRIEAFDSVEDLLNDLHSA